MTPIIKTYILISFDMGYIKFFLYYRGMDWQKWKWITSRFKSRFVSEIKNMMCCIPDMIVSYLVW
jgi:hypothetical protein